MKILITNDDGIFSPGLASLAATVSEIAEVIVMAPDVEQSSKGQAISSDRPINYKKTSINVEHIEAYRVNGTPADCVALGIHLFKDIDMVFSGVNIGANLGNSAWHSGTLSAARQAVLFGIRGVAFSLSIDENEPDFESIKKYISEVLEEIVPLTDVPLLNVNFPRNPTGKIIWTKQSIRHYDGKVVEWEDPKKRKQYWFTVIPIENVEENTDRWAIRMGKISITPMTLDLTDQAYLKKVE